MALNKGIMTGYGADAVYWRVLPSYTIDHNYRMPAPEDVEVPVGGIICKVAGYYSQEQRDAGANPMDEKIAVVYPIPDVNIDGVADLRPAIYQALKSGTGYTHNGKLPHDGGAWVSGFFAGAEDVI